ncbi:MAG: hypothetical protein SynsKO_05390 [Synoicihabitans sp.]
MRKVLHILGHFNDDDIEWMLEVGSSKELADGTTLIAVGDKLDELYFVTAGEFSVELPDGTKLAKLLTGEILGEMSFLEKEPPSVAVKATAEGRVFAIEHEDIHERFRDEPAFEGRLFRALALFLSHRLRGTTSKLGYGKAEKADEIDETEIDTATLQRIQLAGDRFNRLLRQL